MMDIIWKIIIGLLAGAVAKFFMPGKDPSGCIITILLGIGGSVVFSYLGLFLGLYKEGETAGFIGAIIGAMILLFLYKIFLKKKT
jgi:uncharacterized membrane protein YeaQ/YmgE (transglycosylase-associated protein family)